MSDDLKTRRIISAAIDVHRKIGPGYLEKIYEESLAIECHEREIPFDRQHTFTVEYRNQQVGKGRIDFLFFDSVVVEIKAVDRAADFHKAQVISYLKATGCSVGLLLNFGCETLIDGLGRYVI